MQKAEVASLALIQKYADLSGQTALAAGQQAELADEIARATENLNLEKSRLHDLGSWGQAWANKDDLKAYRQALADLNTASEENKALIAQIEQGWANIANAEAIAASQANSWQEAVSVAYGDVSGIAHSVYNVAESVSGFQSETRRDVNAAAEIR